MNSPSLLPLAYAGATATRVSPFHSDRCVGSHPVSAPTHPVCSSRSSHVCSTNGELSGPTIASHVSRGTSLTRSSTRSVQLSVIWVSSRRLSEVLAHEDEPGV